MVLATEELNLTTSTIISFGEKLEEDTSRFYDVLARQQVGLAEIFLSFAKESRMNKVLLTRTYQETISDAFEACFSFKRLDLSSYNLNTDLPKESNQAIILETAIEHEKKATAFYLDMAAKSESLLATIPSAFKKIAERRIACVTKLQALSR